MAALDDVRARTLADGDGFIGRFGVIIIIHTSGKCEETCKKNLYRLLAIRYIFGFCCPHLKIIAHSPFRMQQGLQAAEYIILCIPRTNTKHSRYTSIDSAKYEFLAAHFPNRINVLQILITFTRITTTASVYLIERKKHIVHLNNKIAQADCCLYYIDIHSSTPYEKSNLNDSEKLTPLS